MRKTELINTINIKLLSETVWHNYDIQSLNRFLENHHILKTRKMFWVRDFILVKNYTIKEGEKEQKIYLYVQYVDEENIVRKSTMMIRKRAGTGSWGHNILDDQLEKLEHQIIVNSGECKRISLR